MAEKESVGDGLGTSGFTLGVLSIVFAGMYGIIIAVVGGIFCFVQQKNKKMRIAKVGLILNIIGFCLSILAFLFNIFVLPSLLENFPQV
jgi:glucose uptake protein GlcU